MSRASKFGHIQVLTRIDKRVPWMVTAEKVFWLAMAVLIGIGVVVRAVR